MIEHQRDLEFMNKSLQLAQCGMNTTTPNPRVGCLIVSPQGEIVGEGYHIQAGGPHAEIHALHIAGEKSQGASAYVTLEPCNHQGRTGPCSQALIDAGIAEVVYAMQDPNPLVAGQGLQRLLNAGIKVRGPILEDQAKALNLGFIKRMTTGLPYVRCKLAMSLDGRTAMANGESQWITGPDAREDVQALRARSCSIITGAGTVIADNPAITVRSPKFGNNPRQPLRVVVDSQLRTPKNAQIFDSTEHTVLASVVNQQHFGDTQVWHLPNENNQQVNLTALIQKLGALQHNEVLVEAGPKLAGAFLQAGLVDEIIVYMAGKIMGSRAMPLFELPLNHMSEAVALNITSVTPVGEDWRIMAEPAYLFTPNNKSVE